MLFDSVVFKRTSFLSSDSDTSSVKCMCVCMCISGTALHGSALLKALSHEAEQEEEIDLSIDLMDHAK